MRTPAIETASEVRTLGGMPRGSLPNVKRTTFSRMIPRATVAISHESDPRETKGRTAMRSTSTPQAAHRTRARSTAIHIGHPRVTPNVNARTAPSIMVLPWAKLTVLETAYVT
jgi:hypothetical protein